MRFFEVEKEIMRCAPRRYLINSDGSEASEEHEVSEIIEICTGFNVNIMDENGFRLDHVEFYPVKTDTGTFTDNSEEVLKQIQADYPPDEYQNNDW